MEITVFIYYSVAENEVKVTTYDFWGPHSLRDPENERVAVIGSSRYLFLSEQTITFESDFDPFVARLEGLEWALKEERLASAKRQANIQEQIDNLKCIGHEATNNPPTPDFDSDLPF